MPFSSADPNAYMAIAMQSALGTVQPAAAKYRFFKYLSGANLTPVMAVVDLREGGDGLDYGFSYLQSIKGQGQLVANLRPETAAQLFQLVPGGATWDGASSPAAHTFHSNHASHPYGSINAQHPGSAIVHQLSDVRFSGFTLEANSGDPWKLTAPFTARGLGASGAPASIPTYIAEQPFLYHMSPSYVLDGTGDSTISGFKIDYSLGIEELQAQSVQLDDMVVQNRTCDVEITRRFESPTLWQKIYYGAGVQPTTSVATGSFQAVAQYGAGATLRLIEIVLPLITYRGNPLTELDPDGKTVYETISAKALKAATSMFIARVRNGHPSAYAS